MKVSSFKARSLVSTLEHSWRTQIYGLAISFKELLETIGEIYCQGRRTAKTQAVCLELGPLCSILEFPLLTQPLPIRDAYTGAGQAYLTFSLALEVERPTSKAREKRPGDEVRHFLSNCSLFLAWNVPKTYILLRRCRSEKQNSLEIARTAENFALNIRGALKLRRFSSPDLATLKCHAFLRPTPKRAVAPWGVGERDG